MTEQVKQKRGELAEEYCVRPLPEALKKDLIKYKPDNLKIIQRMEYAAYKQGFDAGYQVEMDEANDKIYHATRKVPELEYEIESLKEQHRMELAGISVCLLQNTKESTKERITKDNPYWTPTYEDACATVDREIALRERIQKLREALTYYACDNKRQGPDFITVELHEMIMDNGKRAREALKRDEEIK